MRFQSVCALRVATTLLIATLFSQELFAAPIQSLQVASQQMVSMRPTRSAPVVSTNFIVYADDAMLAQKISREAERFRKELSIEWLGRELPDWPEKCPITAKIERHAGGETSFAFMPDRTGRSHPMDWQMKIFGPPNRLLDSVLPHEVTHTIFATHFGRPLPRWADEGACTTVEHEAEKKKNHNMLMEFLSASPSRGIPFNRMFTMRNYPHDILPLYAQGYSLARYLIQQKGKRHYIDYVSKGLENERRLHVLEAWNSATNEFYGYKDLSDLQLKWIAWVKKGSPSLDQLEPRTMLAQERSIIRESTNVKTITPRRMESEPANSKADSQLASYSSEQKTFTSQQSGSWYKREMNRQAGNSVPEEDRSTTARKVSQPHMIDARLPVPFRDESRTLWR